MQDKTTLTKPLLVKFGQARVIATCVSPQRWGLGIVLLRAELFPSPSSPLDVPVFTKLGSTKIKHCNHALPRSLCILPGSLVFGCGGWNRVQAPGANMGRGHRTVRYDRAW